MLDLHTAVLIAQLLQFRGDLFDVLIADVSIREHFPPNSLVLVLVDLHLLLLLDHLALPVLLREQEVPRLRQAVLLRDDLVEITTKEVVKYTVEHHEQHALEDAVALDAEEQRAVGETCGLGFERGDSTDADREGDGGVEGEPEHEATRVVALHWEM